MTEEQIIKALEVIASADIGDCSRDCGFYDGKVHFCGGVVAKHSLDIINRQKAEIERLIDLASELTEDNEAWLADNHDLRVILKKRDAEIERLKEFEHMYNDLCK